MFCHLTLLSWILKLFYLSVWFVALKEEFLSYPCSGLLLFPKLVPNSDDQFPLVPGNVKINTYMTSAQDSFWTVLHVQKESCVAVLVEGGHPGSSVTHIWKHSGGGWLLSWSRVPANCPVGIGHTHMHTQKIYCVCPGEAESCNAARSGCGWQTDWQAGRHDDPLSWNESVHRRHSLHRPRLSVCPSPCLFPLSHQLFLPSLTLWLAPSFFFCDSSTVTFCCYKISSTATYEYLLFDFISALRGKETELSFASGNNEKIVVWRYSRLALCLNMNTTDKSCLTHGNQRATFCHKTHK